MLLQNFPFLRRHSLLKNIAPAQDLIIVWNGDGAGEKEHRKRMSQREKGARP